jgi:hypothetical protein
MHHSGDGKSFCASLDSFDLSDTSVSALQHFLDSAPDEPIEKALMILLPYCDGLSRDMLVDMIEANKFEVQHISIAHLPDVELRLAIRLFTVNEPFPLYRWFNAPFFEKVRLFHFVFETDYAFTRLKFQRYLSMFLFRPAAPNHCGFTRPLQKSSCALPAPSCKIKNACTRGQRTGKFVLFLVCFAMSFVHVSEGDLKSQAILSCALNMKTTRLHSESAACLPLPPLPACH